MRTKHARDPERRQRIVNSCLDSIVEHGVAGTSHRKIAALADVPLGSMTYYFDGMEELLREALGLFVEERTAELGQLMGDVESAEQLRDRYVSYVSDVLLDSHRNLVLTLELYTLAARKPDFRTLTGGWMAETQEVLGRFVDEETAVHLDALIEGLSLHRALGQDGMDRTFVERAFDRVMGVSA